MFTFFNFVCTPLLPQTTIDPFMIAAVLHSSGTFLSGKIMIFQRNHDVINSFNSSTMSFYGKGYYTTHKCPGWMQDFSYCKRVLVQNIVYLKIICLKWKVSIPWKPSGSVFIFTGILTIFQFLWNEYWYYFLFLSIHYSQ